MIEALNDEKKYEGKSAFQTIATEFYNQPKTKIKQKKEQIGLVIASIGVDVFAKTGDKIYALLLFICFLCCAREGGVVENNERDAITLEIFTSMRKL